MPHDTLNTRDLLKNSLEECQICRKYFLDNVGLLDHEAGPLSEETSGELLIVLSDYHLLHEAIDKEDDTA